MTIQETSVAPSDAVTPSKYAALERVRGGDGRMRRTVDTVRRDAECAELHAQGWTFQRIADHMGFKNRGVASKAVDRALQRVVTESVERMRQKHDMMINRLLSKTVEIMERDHIAHSQGRIVRIGCPGLDRGEVQHSGCTYGVPGAPYCDGPALLDHGPKLQAITVARGLLERSAKLHGLDAPVRTAIEGDELVIRIKGGVDIDAV